MKPWQVHVAMILTCLSIGGTGIAIYGETLTGREIAGAVAVLLHIVTVKMFWPKSISRS